MSKPATPADEDARTALARLAADRKEDLAGLSRLIGRNPAYVQQFIRRGSPRRLSEADRRTLARYFGVSETLLGGPIADPPPRMVPIARLDVSASAGPGAFADGERVIGRVNFDPAWLRQLGAAPADLSIVRVRGDSMLETLADGDDVLVDRGDGAARLRDGLYVLRLDGTVIVKRIARSSRHGCVSVISDNPAFASLFDIDAVAIEVIGRIRWFGRTLR